MHKSLRYLVPAAMFLAGTVAVHAASEPVVGAVTPASAFVSVAQTFSASYTDPDGVNNCSLFVNGISQGSMTLSGGVNSTTGTASLVHTFSADGTYSVFARCADISANTADGATTNVTVTADATAPSTPTNLVRTSASADTTPTFTWTASTDNAGVVAYEVQIDGGVFTNIGNTTTFTASALAQGSHSINVRALDASGNASGSANLGFSITASVTVAPPTNVVRTSVSTDTTPTFTWTASTDATVTGYDVALDNGAYVSLGNVTTYTSAVLSVGSHSIAVRARDAAGNVSLNSTLSFNITASVSLGAPSNIVRVSGATDTTPTFTWSASADSNVTGYQVSIDGDAFFSVGNTTTFTADVLAEGAHSISVRSMDGSGNVSGSAVLNFNIISGTSPLTPPFGLELMTADAILVANGATRAELESANGRACEWSSLNADAKVAAALGGIANATVHAAIANFAACGSRTTLHLGAGERLGIVNSYRAAFGRLPSTSAHWNDVIKIGNGRFTAETSASAEAAAKVTFQKIYLRAPNMNNENDRNAVIVMAYGLRPLPRSLSAEAAAIVTFRAVYGRNPTSAQDWDAVRATAYSGATR